MVKRKIGCLCVVCTCSTGSTNHQTELDSLLHILLPTNLDLIINSVSTKHLRRCSAFAAEGSGCSGPRDTFFNTFDRGKGKLAYRVQSRRHAGLRTVVKKGFLFI